MLYEVITILEAGIVANLNTDDPAISGIDLRYEYEVAAACAGLRPEQTRRAQLNALEMAFLPASEKLVLQELRRGLNQAATDSGLTT